MFKAICLFGRKHKSRSSYLRMRYKQENFTISKLGRSSRNILKLSVGKNGFCSNQNVEINGTEEKIVIHHGEIKDSEQIFEMAWNNIVSEFGDDKMRFPKEIMFLAGAPGAGKGEMGAFIRKIRGINSDIIETSKLLQTPEASKVKEQGGLVASRHVVQILLKKLLEPELSNGVIVDGFPRTKVQGECIKLLYDRMIDYKKKYDKTAVRESFNRPVFHIMVLFIEEAVSIERQLSRGAKVREHNRRVAETGFGEPLSVRKTDEDAALARHRYREFKEHIYQSMQTVKEYFHFHFVLADANPDIVKARILKELEYQSSVELSESTFDMVRQLPLANEVIRGARQKLTRRLEDYARNHAVLFDQVIKHLLEYFFTIIKYNVLSGKTIIRTEHPIFEKEFALRMAIDLLAERGFEVYVDVQRRLTPEKMENDTIIKRAYKVYQFTIQFNKPTIRSNSQIMI